MTEKEKAKAYDEALERARAINNEEIILGSNGMKL